MIKRLADRKDGLGYSVTDTTGEHFNEVLADFTTFEDAKRYTEMNRYKRLWIHCDGIYVEESIKPLWKLEQEEYMPKHLGEYDEQEHKSKDCG